MSFALQILKDSGSNGDTAGHPAFLLQWNGENFSYFSAGLIFSLVRFFCIKAKEMNKIRSKAAACAYDKIPRVARDDDQGGLECNFQKWLVAFPFHFSLLNSHFCGSGCWRE